MQVNSSNPEFFGAKGVYFVTEKKKSMKLVGEHGKRIICYTEPCSSIVLSPSGYEQIFILDDHFTNI